MLESGTPIYLSESKKLLRYSRKLKGAKMNENLIAEAVAAINIPPSSLGPRYSLALAPFRDEVCKPLLRRGFSPVVWSFLRLKWVGLLSRHPSL